MSSPREQILKLSAREVIEFFQLESLQGEGGFFRQTYKAAQEVLVGTGSEPPYRRAAGTAILYLITPESYSNWHRLKHDEVFHFYLGGSVEMTQKSSEGSSKKIQLGHDFLHGEQLQVLVPRGTWQSTRLLEDHGWALLGCTVNPGFEYEDFELEPC
jgi:predicted cupin superfamily sugar epimerase